jgi:ubiquitin carboxyl-terminal hydrolase 7
VFCFQDVSDKEFEKYRLSLVLNGRARYLDEENIKSVRLRDFASAGQNSQNSDGQQQHAKPYIGLQHVNKNSKRARYNYMEKAIKIYN